MPKFCIHCGNKLEPNSKFCTECGEPTEAMSPDTGAADSTVAMSPDSATADSTVAMPDSTQHAAETVAIPTSDQYAPDATIAMPPINSQSPGANTPINAAFRPTAPTTSIQEPRFAQAPAQSSNKSKIIIGVLIAVIVLLLVGGGVALALIQPWNSDEPEPAPVTEQPPAPEDTPDAPDSAVVPGEDLDEDNDDNEADEAEAEIYRALTSYYNELNGLDARVRECANEFNENYLSEDMSKRSEKARVCSTLLDDLVALQSSYNELAIDIPSSSKYRQNYEDIDTLYFCLIQRTAVIYEAWNISLSYAKPADHKDEILAPIDRDNVSGVNIYKSEYDTLYPNARPVE